MDIGQRSCGNVPRLQTVAKLVARQVAKLVAGDYARFGWRFLALTSQKEWSPSKKVTGRITGMK
jgi:hypothetical protein